MFPLLNCCVEAAVSRLGKFLVCLVPGGGALVEFVEFGADVWERWKKQKPAEADRGEELQALAHASAERVGAAVQAAIQAEAAGQPVAVKRKLTAYLIQVQVTVRRTLCRPADPEGRTVPADLRLNSAEDLLPLLPPQLPRFEPGELNPPPRRGVPGWVWLAGSAVVVVVVVLVVRNGWRPKTPDGPPVAAKSPDGDDRPKDADAAAKRKDVTDILNKAQEKERKAEKDFKLLVSKLKSPNPQERAQAAKALGSLGEDAVSAAYDLCEAAAFDAVPEVKRSALEALEKVQPKLYPLAVTLTLPPEISAGQCPGYINAIKELPAFGRVGLPLIAAQLQNPDLGRGQLVSGAYSLLLHSHADALAAIASDDDDALKLLLNLPESPLALKYLASSPGSRSSLDGAVGQRLQAIGKAHQKARKTVVPYFIKLLASADADERQRAADALGSFGPDANAALPALRQRKLDAAERVRNAVRAAIANIERDNK